MNPERMEVMAPAMKAKVVHAYPSCSSTKKKITKAIKTTKTAMYLYSAARNAAEPRSM